MNANLVVAALAAVAVVVSAVGVAKSDDWTSERDYAFRATTQAAPSLDPRPAGAAPAVFDLVLPANATGANLTVTVVFTGQTVQGGNVIVKATAVAPDGTRQTPVLTTLALGQGATTGQTTLVVQADWMPVPGTTRDTQIPEGRTWDNPLRIEVTAERPSDLPVATYGFTASLQGTVSVYQADL